jgi:hypothetical protein
MVEQRRHDDVHDVMTAAAPPSMVMDAMLVERYVYVYSHMMYS